MGKPLQEPGKHFRHGLLEGFLFFYDTYLGIPLEHLEAVRSPAKIRGEVRSGMVAFHVKAALPELAFTDIENPALVDNVYRFSILTIVLGQCFNLEFFHPCYLPVAFD